MSDVPAIYTPPTERLKDERQRLALEGMLVSGTLAAASRKAGVSRSTIVNWRDTDPDFAEALAEAEETHVDDVVEQLKIRGVDGDEQIVYFKGEPIPKRDMETGEPLLDDDFNPIYHTRIIKSDDLLKFYLKSKRAEFREKTDLTLLGPGGGPVQTDNTVNVQFVMPTGRTADDYEGSTEAPGSPAAIEHYETAEESKKEI